MPRLSRSKYSSIIIKSISIIAILLVLIRVFLFPKTTNAAWFDDNYRYRQKVTLGNSGSADANKKVKFDIDTAVLIAAGKMVSTCDDTRFTDGNGKMLQYYLDASGGACNTNSTDYYVLVPTINGNSNATTVYMYYGYSLATAGTQSSQIAVATFSPTSGPTFASEERGTTPALYWKFDEGSGTDIHDSTSYSNNGYIISPMWQTSSMCRTGSCGRFDVGTYAYKSVVPSEAELAFDADSFSLSVWARHGSSITGQEDLISKWDRGGRGIPASGVQLYMDENGSYCGMIKDDSGNTEDIICSTTHYLDNLWHNVQFVKSGISSITLYVDGRQVASNSSLNSNSTVGNGSIFLSAGVNMGNGDGQEFYWIGYIDEVKIYKYAKSSEQINAEYNAKGSSETASATLGASDQSSLTNGLIGYWNMDEGTSTTAADSSGNGYNGTLTNGPTWADGKFGKSVNFDGGSGSNSDIIVVSDQTLYEVTTFTTAAWIYRTGTCQFSVCPIIAKGMSGNIGYGLELVDSSGYKVRLGIRDGLQNVTGTTTIATNTWYHIAATVDGSTVKVYVNGILDAQTAQTVAPVFSTESLTLGNRNTNKDVTYNGRIDEARLYNRVLSDSEIRALYEWAPGPVGYWAMNESLGTSAYDSSGNANTGTLTSGPTWTSGKYGKSVKFDGSDDEINAGSGATVDGLSTLTASAWIYPNSMGGGSTGRVIEKTTGWILAVSGTNQVEFFAGFPSTTLDTATITNAITIGRWNHVAVVWDGTNTAANVQFYVNGVKIAHSFDTNGAGTPHTDDSAESIHIGNNNVASRGFDGKIDEVRIYNYQQSQKQIVSDMNAGHPAVGSPVGSAVANWSFDEGYGTTANDSSINLNALTLNAASWTNSGKFGKAWNGDGTNWLTRANDDDFNFTGTDDFSISMWFKSDPSSAPSTQEYLLSKAESSAGYRIFAQTDGDIVFGTDDDSSWTPDDKVGDTGANNKYDGNWHHVVATKTGTTRLDLYIDGVLVESDTSIAGTATLSNTVDLFIGDRNGVNGGDEFNGDIDEVKMYRYVLNADDVKTEYNRGKSQVMGALSTASNGVTADNSSSREYCVPGDTTSCSPPIGEWKLDEATGTTAFDTSGNGRNGTLTATKSIPWAPGKYGRGVNLDNNHDYITVADNNAFSVNTTNKLSVMGWVKYDTLGATSEPFNKGQGSNYEWAIRVFSDGSVRAFLFTSAGGNYLTTTQSAAGIISVGQWYHLAIVADTTAPVLNFYVNGKLIATSSSTAGAYTNGTASMRFGEREDVANGTDGTIDGVRIYDYARTAAQIAWDYNRGGPVGWWKFDECQGETAYDASGNSYNGTITPGNNTGDNDTAGTCSSGTTTEMWNDGTTGKYNSSLDFDGTNDYVDMGDRDILNAISISAWIYWDAATTNDGIVSKRTASEAAGDWSFRMSDNNDSKLEWMVWSGVDSSNNDYSRGTISTGAWHHVVVTFDNANNNTKFYIDGVLDSTDTAGTNDISDTPETLKIGSAGQSSDFFDGRIDDVRIYNYILTETQVKTVYNNGAAVLFAPSTGSP